MKGRAKVKRIAAAVLCVILLCSVMSASVFAKNYTSASKTISGHTLSCDISYFAATSQDDPGEIKVQSHWSGDKTTLKLTVTTVDALTGEETSFGNSSFDGYAIGLFYAGFVPITDAITIYACAEALVDGTFHALYAELANTDGTP